MILAVDTGNTHTVLGVIDENGHIVNVFRLQTNQRRTEHEYAADIYRILRLGGIAPKSMTGAIISTVVPSLTETLRRAVRMVTGQEAMIVGAGLKTGLDIGLDDPGTIAAMPAWGSLSRRSSRTPPCCPILKLLRRSGRSPPTRWRP